MHVIGFDAFGSILIEFEGVKFVVPDDPANGHRGLISAWEAAGNTIPPYVPPSEDLAAYARDFSWQVRISGVDINGVRVKCDDGAIALINGMAMLANRDEARIFSFDTGDGILSLTATEAIELAEKVGEFVQLTFDRRADVYAAITNGTVTTTAEIDAAFVDVTDNWPEG